MNRTFFARWSGWILTATVILLPALGYGVHRAMSDANNDVRDWLPEGFAETRQYEWFVSHFGSEEMAVVSWPGATLDDQRIDLMAEQLAPLTEPAEGALFHRLLTGRQAVAELTAPPLELSREEAVERMQGLLIGPEGEMTGVVAMVNRRGAADRHAALAAVREAAEAVPNLEPSELHIGGPTADSVALDTESTQSRYRLASLSVIVALVLAWRCLREKRLVAAVFAAALLSTGVSVALVHYLGGEMSVVMVTMPTLIYVLSISGAIHLANYYRDALRHGGAAGATERAVGAAWMPVLLTAFTTALGLGSLGVSEVLPVKTFGIYSAIGVLASVPVLLLVLPALLEVLSARGKTAEHEASAIEGDDDLASAWSGRAAAWVDRHNGVIVAASLAAMVGLGVGLARLETSVKLLNLFSSDSRIVNDYAWLEERLGPLVPVEVVLRFSPDSSLGMLERMELVNNMQGYLEGLEKVGGVTSAATLAPELPTGGGVRQMVARSVLEKKLERSRERFVESQYLSQTREGELWRVSARVEAMNKLDYGQFIGRLRSDIDPGLKEYAAATGGQIDATYTGVVPLVYKAQRELLNDLTASFLTAFGLIAVVMIALLRAVRAGVLTMLPNVFPAVIVFGAMGWSGRLLDIGSMMTASIALGIAVDDTIHFLSWFRRGLSRGLSRRDAVALAYQRCAGAMLQTTIVCGLGVLVFAMSNFVPTARFATLMCTMLATALVGDLLMLPALLVSPLGKCFEQSVHRRLPARLTERLQPALQWANAVRGA